MTDINVNNQNHLTGISFWLGWTMVFVIYIVLRINLIDIPLDRDEGIFGYSGQVILNGGLPYKDVFDHKPPLVFYINALALLIFPPTAFGIHCFLHLYNLLTLIALYRCATVYTKSRMTGLWVALIYAVFSSIPSIQGFTASTEMYLLLPMTLSLLFTVKASELKNSNYLVVSGTCSALAFFTKQTSAPMIMFILLFIIVARINSLRVRPISLKELAVDLAKWSTGFLGITALIAAYFYYHKIFDAFFYWSFTHNFLYSQSYGLSSTLPRIYAVMIAIVKSNLPLVLVIIAGNLMALLKSDHKAYFVLLFLLLSLLSTVPGVGYRHYFAQIAPAMALAGGFGFAFLAKFIRKKNILPAISVLFALSVIGAPVAVNSGYYITKNSDQISRDFFGYNPFPESNDIAEFLAQRTAEEDSVFILGSETQIFMLSQRASATSFAIIYPLMSSFPRYMEFQNTTWQEVKANKPKYIITIPLPTSFLWDGKANLWIVKKTGQLIKDDYYLEAAVKPGNPKGQLLYINETDQLPVNQQKKCLALIYRRKPVSATD